MKYKSICCICGRETISYDTIMEHYYNKEIDGFIEIMLSCGRRIGYRSINFCPSCSKKSYTIEDLKTIGNYNQWSY